MCERGGGPAGIVERKNTGAERSFKGGVDVKVRVSVRAGGQQTVAVISPAVKLLRTH